MHCHRNRCRSRRFGTALPSAASSSCPVGAEGLIRLSAIQLVVVLVIVFIATFRMGIFQCRLESQLLLRQHPFFCSHMSCCYACRTELPASTVL